MKKIFLTIALIALPTMLFAQTFETQKQMREQRRVERVKMYESELMSAVAAKNFTFIAQTLQPSTGAWQTIDPTANYVGIYPKFIDVVLPSQGNSWVVSPAYNLDLYVNNFTYNFNTGNGNVYVIITFQNAMGEQPNNFTRDFSYTFHFTISMVSGAASLTIVPNYSSPVTYQGTVQFNK